LYKKGFDTKKIFIDARITLKNTCVKDIYDLGKNENVNLYGVDLIEFNENIKKLCLKQWPKNSVITDC
jgi:hypothetical protein